MIDWLALQEEYVTTQISLRDLAKKHQLGTTDIYKRSKREGWVEKRRQCAENRVAKAIEAVGEQQAEAAKRLVDSSFRLLDKIDESIELLDPLDRAGFKQITGAMEDIRKILMLKSRADIREQEARIANLERQANGDGAQGPLEVVFVKPEEQA